MNELVIDSSAYVFTVTTRSQQAAALREKMLDAACHAPYHADAEVGNVLRRLELAGEISSESALAALRSWKHVISERYPHVGPLSEAAWRLRGAVTFYDALYVALAAQLDVPLLTADARLSRTPDLPCEVELLA